MPVVRAFCCRTYARLRLPVQITAFRRISTVVATDLYPDRCVGAFCCVCSAVCTRCRCYPTHCYAHCVQLPHLTRLPRTLRVAALGYFGSVALPRTLRSVCFTHIPRSRLPHVRSRRSRLLRSAVIALRVPLGCLPAFVVHWIRSVMPLPLISRLPLYVVVPRSAFRRYVPRVAVGLRSCAAVMLPFGCVATLRSVIYRTTFAVADSVHVGLPFVLYTHVLPAVRIHCVAAPPFVGAYVFTRSLPAGADRFRCVVALLLQSQLIPHCCPICSATARYCLRSGCHGAVRSLRYVCVHVQTRYAPHCRYVYVTTALLHVALRCCHAGAAFWVCTYRCRATHADFAIRFTLRFTRWVRHVACVVLPLHTACRSWLRTPPRLCPHNTAVVPFVRTFYACRYALHAGLRWLPLLLPDTFAAAAVRYAPRYGYVCHLPHVTPFWVFVLCPLPPRYRTYLTRCRISCLPRRLHFTARSVGWVRRGAGWTFTVLGAFGLLLRSLRSDRCVAAAFTVSALPGALPLPHSFALPCHVAAILPHSVYAARTCPTRLPRLRCGRCYVAVAFDLRSLAFVYALRYAFVLTTILSLRSFTRCLLNDLLLFCGTDSLVAIRYAITLRFVRLRYGTLRYVACVQVPLVFAFTRYHRCVALPGYRLHFDFVPLPLPLRLIR